MVSNSKALSDLDRTDTFLSLFREVEIVLVGLLGTSDLGRLIDSAARCTLSGTGSSSSSCGVSSELLICF